MILKTHEFSSANSLAEFVMKNNIKRENVIAITSGRTSSGSLLSHFLFFYGDSDVKELTHGVFGWS